VKRGRGKTHRARFPGLVSFAVALPFDEVTGGKGRKSQKSVSRKEEALSASTTACTREKQNVPPVVRRVIPARSPNLLDNVFLLSAFSSVAVVARLV
jgi:hypothetical protein